MNLPEPGQFAEKLLNEIILLSMASNPLSTTTISVLTRHSKKCPKRDDARWKRCRCRKTLYIYEDGKARYMSAKTRSWEQAEKVAQEERDKRDPVKIELARISAFEESRRLAAQAHQSTIEDALDQWIAGFDVKGDTARAYATFKKTMLAWADEKKFVLVGDVPSDALDAWKNTWELAPNTKRERLRKVKSFFRWCHDLHKIDFNPAVKLKGGRAENLKVTQPLTPRQFEELIAATYEYDKERRVEKDRFGADLRAIFLVMRWTGVRLSDALMLRRSAVIGDRLTISIQKTKGTVKKVITRRVPVELIEALTAVPVRKRMHPDQYFWSRKCSHRVLAGMWTPRIRLLNKYFAFRNDHGEVMSFHSHMLRDTFAVELFLVGVPLEQVSKLLCHSSVRITEKHYSPWVKSREQQLEEGVIAAMQKMGATFANQQV